MNRILIVEDQESFAEYVARLIEPLQQAFPGCAIQIVGTLPEGLKAAGELKPLSCTLLDLTLPPNTADETIEAIKEFEKHSPVVIVTGHNPAMVKKKLIKEMEIVYKPDLVTKGSGIIYKAIEKAITAWHRNRDDFEAQHARIERLRELANDT